MSDHHLNIPAVSAIVSTRNRAHHIFPCVAAILANAGSDFELLVIDQSDTDDSRRALEPVLGDPRLRYVLTKTRGLSRSRNVAIAESRAPILAFTDDDCRPPPDWIANVRTVFAAYPKVALAFGTVGSPAASAPGGFAAEFAPPQDRIFEHEIPDIAEPWGVGANMILRSSTFERIGTFDPILGAGAVFPAWEDSDIAVRVLAAGLPMLYSSELYVEHLGVRQGVDASKLMRAYGMGMGAALSKHARLGTPGARAMLGRWLKLHGLRVLGNFARGVRPLGAGYFVSGLRGMYEARNHALDRRNSVFSETE